jgi:hypothetical protein
VSPESSTPATVQSPAQAELFDASSASGWAALTPREQRFVQALLEGNNQTKAAEIAQIANTPNAQAVGAHRLVRQPRVRAVLGQLWTRAGASMTGTLRQAAEIQARAFAQWQEGSSSANRKEAFEEWLRASTLLASIHGKLQIKVEGSVEHRHYVITPEMESDLIEARRRTVIHLGEGGPANGRAA